jgi:septal ring factor EnvC (AmiA/AmiB activator)
MLDFPYISLLSCALPGVSLVTGRTSLSAARYRERMAELNVEIEKLQHEITRKQAKGKSTDDLDKKLDELEREKHDLVERIGELSIA